MDICGSSATELIVDLGQVLVDSFREEQFLKVLPPDMRMLDLRDAPRCIANFYQDCEGL